MATNESPVYLILGATGGIGSALSRRLADRGAALVLGARSEDDLNALASDTGGDAHPLDATDYEQVQAIVDHTTDTHDRLDGVVNCVGSILLKPAHLTSIEEYRETVALNLDTSFFLVKAAARAMMKNGGSIVLSSSAVARTGLNNHEAIAAAKAGVVGLARAAAATYANRGIRVNAVAPGLVQTPMSEHITSSKAGRKQSEAMHPLGRLGEPEDVAVAIDWLLDRDRSNWVTGQVIGVDGGLGTVRSR
ncbi:MAG: SDR family oxidoreductase [Bacteroidetes bacterium]|jgi:NAD(P)-dependent dehydrogenase (short-subunit alcohol dehydrogenase family)|nr:SDR family oxidoreductase [Bacteroidota bacterium]